MKTKKEILHIRSAPDAPWVLCDSRGRAAGPEERPNCPDCKRIDAERRRIERERAKGADVVQTAARPTRFAELSYRQQGAALWRFVDNATGAVVGQQYRTKGELLADLDRYATLFGCKDATNSMSPELILRGNGPECMWSHAPGVWYDSPEQAEPARDMEPADAYTHALAIRTLAQGDRLHEHVVRAKVVNKYPLSTTERAWLDARTAQR
jgi:hypothetical protein